MEVFSDLLRVIRLNVSIYHNALVCGNWCLREKELGITCFHMVTMGACRLEVPGFLSTTLSLGDLVIFPKELIHTMEPLEESFEHQIDLTIEQPSIKRATGILSCEVRFQHRASDQLLAALPPVLFIPNDKGNNWLDQLAGLIVTQSSSNSVGSSMIVNHLSEIIFMYALRHFIIANPESTGILSLYIHPRLSKAINLMHKNPERDWTLDVLAKKAAHSRTQFAKSFRETSGFTPIAYLKWWRMQLAWMFLSEGDSIHNVSKRVGYKSETSFLRTFKKTFAVSAGQVRRAVTKKDKND